jgi:hypothetical protein
MAMFQVDDVAVARQHARGLGVREVFEVAFDDITEAHLHPADMRGAIVSISQPDPAPSWRWGGPDWERHSVPGRIAGITVGVANPAATEERWAGVIGATPGVEFVTDEAEPGIVAIQIDRDGELVAIKP